MNKFGNDVGKLNPTTNVIMKEARNAGEVCLGVDEFQLNINNRN